MINPIATYTSLYNLYLTSIKTVLVLVREIVGKSIAEELITEMAKTATDANSRSTNEGNSYSDRTAFSSTKNLMKS